MKATAKTNYSELAICGGEPAFEEALHVGRPNIPNPAAVLEKIQGAFSRRWFTNNGPLVQELEAAIAKLLGVRHCIAMCNGTVALEIAIRALKLEGEVIVPSYTFIATAHSLQWQEITPVFCDIDPATHTLDPARVEEMITPRTTGIIGVHLWGRPCHIEALEEIARRRNLALMFDASHAFMCSHQGKRIGHFGRLEVFSFHATKFFNTFEGGALVTNDDELAGKIRLMKNFGFAGYDNVVCLGTNGKMSEISAAMGIVGLGCLEETIEVNKANYGSYGKGLAGTPGLRLIERPAGEWNFQYVVVEVNEEEARVTRDHLMEVLHAERVIARRYFWPGCHRMEPYRALFPHAGLLLPETEQVAGRVLVLPTGTAVGEAEISVICDILRAAVIN